MLQIIIERLSGAGAAYQLIRFGGSTMQSTILASNDSAAESMIVRIAFMMFMMVCFAFQ